ncbi:hypothetical protein CKAH01_06163 [Colletotrichum kahawae]|uniref:Secreted protein n=1 Tax=Colletotrichum kahawae TaxID=34407 RepID=A0AAE0D4D0_COLKA|nr:hypothetical protein CcaCcLH18_08675 [Colletotrichum camelliae]KAK2752922.1 hypothetical protein CKAH01_06163 [Colletotrichum kahawae]
MVSFTLPALATLALAALANGAPTTQTESVEIFSFAKWVDGIIANPDGDNLTPEEAVEAWQASLNETSAVAESGLLQKRVICNTEPNTEAYVPDAVTCINDLARKGGQACEVSGSSNFCTVGRARIIGVAGGGVTYTSSSCNDVARGAGLVMDSCTRADNTVQGAEKAWGNGNLLVWIRRP